MKGGSDAQRVDPTETAHGQHALGMLRRKMKMKRGQ
jgi:hypothetical protein